MWQSHTMCGLWSVASSAGTRMSKLDWFITHVSVSFIHLHILRRLSGLEINFSPSSEKQKSKISYSRASFCWGLSWYMVEGPLSGHLCDLSLCAHTRGKVSLMSPPQSMNQGTTFTTVCGLSNFSKAMPSRTVTQEHKVTTYMIMGGVTELSP